MPVMLGATGRPLLTSSGRVAIDKSCCCEGGGDQGPPGCHVGDFCPECPDQSLLITIDPSSDFFVGSTYTMSPTVPFGALCQWNESFTFFGPFPYPSFDIDLRCWAAGTILGPSSPGSPVLPLTYDAWVLQIMSHVHYDFSFSSDEWNWVIGPAFQRGCPPNGNWNFNEPMAGSPSIGNVIFNARLF
jgi:hypothetical protein